MSELPLPPPFRWEGPHIGADLAGGRVLFTTRRGGVSSGRYASLNFGLRTGDDAANVHANRDRLAATVGVPWERFVYGLQVHGARVRRATAPVNDRRAEEDGQATALRGVAPVVAVADCLPVLLVAKSAVAALHGGWRGIVAGVLEEGVQAVRDVGADGPVAAAIGPGIGACCFQVGPEVHAAFGQPEATGTVDLAAAARQRLLAAGVTEVHDVGLCTMCADPALFFSHRRDGGVTGRQAAVVWRT